jgi:hypothetical protein
MLVTEPLIFQKSGEDGEAQSSVGFHLIFILQGNLRKIFQTAIPEAIDHFDNRLPAFWIPAIHAGMTGSDAAGVLARIKPYQTKTAVN